MRLAFTFVLNPFFCGTVDFNTMRSLVVILSLQNMFCMASDFRSGLSCSDFRSSHTRHCTVNPNLALGLLVWAESNNAL